jgi:uncharacterized membrane protein YeaQ/YmgE (transglycosylase-associated protein family)
MDPAVIDVLITLFIGLSAGWLAGHIMRGSGFGIAGDLIIGILGAFVGGMLFGVVGLSASGLIGRLLMSTIGAVALIYAVRLLKRA